MEIVIPQKLTNNFQGIVFFTELYHRTKKCYGEEVIFNFEETKVFESNLFSVLGCLISSLEKKKNKPRLLGIQEPLANLFNTKKLVNGTAKKDLWKHLIKCQNFTSSKEEALSEYLETKIFPERPDISLNQHLKMAIQLCVAEAFRNAFVHSKCREVFISHYFSVYNKKLFVSIVNKGKTFIDISSINHPISAVEWAVKNGTTTLSKEHKGIGLYTIRQFVQQNQGKIQIMSGNAVWKQVKQRTFSKEYEKAFPGTLITLEFNL
jgi:anti-sigma regulatory factor (Ser/Thr protein kinase)